MTVIDLKRVISDAPPVRQSSIAQVVALASRDIRYIIKYRDWQVAVIAPLIFTAGYYLPLQWIMSRTNPHLNYGQYLIPIIVLQTASFVMGAIAAQAAIESSSGLTVRLNTMPVKPYVPFTSNMITAAFRSVISVAATIVYGHFIGFRFHDFASACGLLAFAITTTVVLAIGADALGNLVKSPAVISQALTLPTLIFGMMSTGFVPETAFPGWIRPFVRNQPISHITHALRTLADGTADMKSLLPGVIWLVVAALVFAPLAIVGRRRR